MTTTELLAQLKHPNPHMRDRAMWDIVDSTDETKISQLMSVLDNEDTTYRRAAVKTLGAIGHDTVPALVTAMLDSDNVTVRGSAAKALAQVALNYPEDPFPQAGIDGLAKALHDDNPVVNVAAAMAMGAIGSPTVDLLIEVLTVTDNPALAISILNALCTIGDPRCVEEIQRLAADESIDAYVKESAVSALSRLEMTAKFNVDRAG